MDSKIKETLIEWALEYNDPEYFQEDPIIFPTQFARKMKEGKAVLADVEIAALLSSHLAWGRRSMIVRDCERLFDEMCWRPYDYIMNGEYRDEAVSLHRTIKWSEIAAICKRLQGIYQEQNYPQAKEEGKSQECASIEGLSDMEIRCRIFGQKEDRRAPNKKINMMRRWMVRDDGKVDLGVWKKSDKSKLLIPLDVHVYEQATALGLTGRKQKDLTTAMEITDCFKEIWPDDPCMGDFALFGYGVSKHK